MSQPDLRKDFKRLMESIDRTRGDKVACNGQIFRASASEYYSQGPADDISFGYRVKLRRMVSMSCPGCEKCGWLFEYFTEVNIDDLHINGIENAEDGQLYEITGSFSGYGEDADFDGLSIRKVKRNMITYRKKGINHLVYLDGKRSGTIRPVFGGFKYFPFRHEEGGETFQTLDEVKASLDPPK